MKSAPNFRCENKRAVRRMWRKNTAGRQHRLWAVMIQPSGSRVLEFGFQLDPLVYCVHSWRHVRGLEL